MAAPPLKLPRRGRRQATSSAVPFGFARLRANTAPAATPWSCPWKDFYLDPREGIAGSIIQTFTWSWLRNSVIPREIRQRRLVHVSVTLVRIIALPDSIPRNVWTRIHRFRSKGSWAWTLPLCINKTGPVLPDRGRNPRLKLIRSKNMELDPFKMRNLCVGNYSNTTVGFCLYSKI